MKDLDQLAKEIKIGLRDPYTFMSGDLENVYRMYAKKLHPDRYPEEEREQAKQLFQQLGQIKEAALKPPEILESKEHKYEIRSVIGRGDLCDVLYGLSLTATDAFDRATPVVIKRPFVTAPAANNLMAKEREVLEILHEPAKGHVYDFFMPVPVESFLKDKRRINVFRYREGLYNGLEISAAHGPLDNRHIAWMYKRLMMILGFIHRQKWRHCAITPQHCLWSVADHGLQLCGWIHSVQYKNNVSVVPANYKVWYGTEKRASRALDIRLATMTVTELAGGEGKLHPLIRNFFRSAYLTGRMATSDAWEVHDRFNDMLDLLYGPPVFVPLEM